MTELKQLITDALAVGLSDRSIIELMVMEGLPREASPEILRCVKTTITDQIGQVTE
jgi:hypothetical protein